MIQITNTSFKHTQIHKCEFLNDNVKFTFRCFILQIVNLIYKRE